MRGSTNKQDDPGVALLFVRVPTEIRRAAAANLSGTIKQVKQNSDTEPHVGR